MEQIAGSVFVVRLESKPSLDGFDEELTVQVRLL